MSDSPPPVQPFQALLQALIEAGRNEVEMAKERLGLMRRLVDLAEKCQADAAKPAAETEAPEIRLSKREIAILDVIGDGCLKGEQIAKLLDLEYGGSFKETMRALTGHGFLGNNPGEGYFRRK